MRQISNYLLLSFALMLAATVVMAQKGSLRIVGVIQESQGNQPVEFATVVVKSNTTENIITGTTSGNGGMFELRTDSTDIFIEVSFIG